MDRPKERTDPTVDTSSGLSVFQTWPAVYKLVLATFFVWVALLTALSWVYS